MAHVEELTIELVKGPGGFGMDITDSGHVVGNTAGGVAEAAGARHTTRAVGQLAAAHPERERDAMCAGVPTEHTKIRAVNGIEVRRPSRAVTARVVLAPPLKPAARGR